MSVHKRCMICLVTFIGRIVFIRVGTQRKYFRAEIYYLQEEVLNMGEENYRPPPSLASTPMLWGQVFSKASPILPTLLITWCLSHTCSVFCGLSSYGRNISRHKFLSWTLYLSLGFHGPLASHPRGPALISKIAATFSLMYPYTSTAHQEAGGTNMSTTSGVTYSGSYPHLQVGGTDLQWGNSSPQNLFTNCPCLSTLSRLLYSQSIWGFKIAEPVLGSFHWQLYIKSVSHTFISDILTTLLKFPYEHSILSFYPHYQGCMAENDY